MKNLLTSWQKADFIKDLGVTFDSKLKFDKHTYEKINKPCKILGLIKLHYFWMYQEYYIAN